MPWCREPFAASMPSRTRAQKEARLKRAREEQSMYYKLWHMVGRIADRNWDDYMEVTQLVKKLEKQLAR